MTDVASASHELVSFDRPPVEEIAFAVQLVDPQLSLEDMVDIGRELQPHFPVQQLQPPLPRMVASVSPQPFAFSTTIGVSLPRFWFVAEDGLRLVQVQEDRLAFNWRRLGGEARYPRYSRLRAEFEEILARIAQVVPGLNGDAGRAEYCELTYVNELETPEPREAHLPLEAVLRVVQPLKAPEFLPPPTQAHWMGSWTLLDRAGDPAGELSADARPALRQRDQRPIYLLTMTGVLPGEVAGTDAVLDRLDLAHEWIVRGFADLTTEDMHDQWERTK